jgi:predicted RNA-binding protein (virulence factor B family)
MHKLIGHFATLPVVSITSIGAFLDWGEEKDLFLPLNEQTAPLAIDNMVPVFIYLDKQERPCSSMRLERFASEEMPPHKVEQKVRGLVYQETDLGYKVLVDEKYLGMLYKNEVFKELFPGDEIDAYVKKVRIGDRKLDLNLRPAGHNTNDDISANILTLLQENNGFLNLDDKTPPEKVYELFGVSKKKYKMALGQLYKSRHILIEADGIRLAKKI